MFQCQSLRSSHPHLLLLSPKVCSFHLNSTFKCGHDIFQTSLLVSTVFQSEVAECLFASEWTNANRNKLTWFHVSCVPICSCSVALSCLTLCLTLPGSSGHGIFPGKNAGVGCQFLFWGCAHSYFPFSFAVTADLSLNCDKREAIHIVGLELTSICILSAKEQSCQR